MYEGVSLYNYKQFFFGTYIGQASPLSQASWVCRDDFQLTFIWEFLTQIDTKELVWLLFEGNILIFQLQSRMESLSELTEEIQTLNFWIKNYNFLQICCFISRIFCGIYYRNFLNFDFLATFIFVTDLSYYR